MPDVGRGDNASISRAFAHSRSNILRNFVRNIPVFLHLSVIPFGLRML
jgi:hypothetical protein